MAAFYAQFPASASGSNASVGTNGAPAPGSSTLVAGENPSGLQQPLQTDANGNLLVTPDPTSVQHVIVDSSALPTGAATEATLESIDTSTNEIAQDTSVIIANTANLSRLSGSLVPTAYNEVDLTYVPSGNGVGQIQTAVYKLAGVTVKTLTLTYDASNNLSTVVAT